EVDIVRIREDFEIIWNRNLVEVKHTRQGNAQGGDYFSDDEDTNPNETTIFLNIQGQSQNFKRMQQGIVTEESYHAYAKFDEKVARQNRKFDEKRDSIINKERGSDRCNEVRDSKGKDRDDRGKGKGERQERDDRDEQDRSEAEEKSWWQFWK
ncbi:MAG: hypothetical protein IH836_09265, partial [Proteobacteria bacterium]|nr:hypothetical protein [Pseudomonadota bacterium]